MIVHQAEANMNLAINKIKANNIFNSNLVNLSCKAPFLKHNINQKQAK